MLLNSYKCSCVKDAMMEGEWSLTLVRIVQQCDTIRTHWQRTSRLSLGLWCAPGLFPAVQAYLFHLVTLVVILPRKAPACQLITSVQKWCSASRKMKTLKKFVFSFIFPWTLFFHAFSTWGLIKPKLSSLLFLSCHCNALWRNTRT